MVDLDPAPPAAVDVAGPAGTVEQPTSSGTPIDEQRTQDNVVIVDEDEDAEQPAAKKVCRTLRGVLKAPQYNCSVDADVDVNLKCTLCSSDTVDFLMKKRIVTAELHIESVDSRRTWQQLLTTSFKLQQVRGLIVMSHLYHLLVTCSVVALTVDACVSMSAEMSAGTFPDGLFQLDIPAAIDKAKTVADSSRLSLISVTNVLLHGRAMLEYQQRGEEHKMAHNQHYSTLHWLQTAAWTLADAVDQVVVERIKQLLSNCELMALSCDETTDNKVSQMSTHAYAVSGWQRQHLLTSLAPPHCLPMQRMLSRHLSAQLNPRGMVALGRLAKVQT